MILAAPLAYYSWLLTADGNGGGSFPSNVAEAHDTIILAMIALIATSIGGLVYVIKTFTLGKETARDAKEANKAVNNIAPGDQRLYAKITTLVAEVKIIKNQLHAHQKNWEDFNARWGSLPEDLNDSADLVVMLHDIRHSITQINEKLDAHLDWAAENLDVKP